MLQIRTTINGELRYLDLYGDEDVKLEISFAEVQDITEKNSGHTQRFKLPGSKNNNDIFNHFYEFDASMIDYDPRQKFDCELMLDGVSLYSGYLRLNSATRDKEEIIYDVAFYSEVGNLVANIGDKLLSDIDFSNLSHAYNPSNVVTSYAADNTQFPYDNSTNPLLNGKVHYALLSKGYQYTGQTFDDTNIDYTDTALIDFVFEPNSSGGEFGYFTNAATPAQWYYLTPSLQIKDIYERIYTGAGYNIQSEFMDTDYFKQYYMPLTFEGDSIYISSVVDPKYTFVNDNWPPTLVPTTGYTWTEQPATSISTERVPHTVVTVDNFDATYSDNSFRLYTPGTYRARITFSGRNSELFPETVPLDAEVQFHLRYSNNETFDSGSTLTFTKGDTLYNSGTYVLSPGFSVNNITITFNFTYYNLSPQAFCLDVETSEGAALFELQDVKFEILEGPRQIPSGELDLTQELPCCQYKQLDFIASINQFFNMVTVPIPGDPKTLRIEPVIDFIGKGETLDWTDKVNRDEPIQVEPLTDIIEGTLNYMYEEDDGWGNETYTKANNYVYGNNTIELNQDYKDKSTDFETEFGSTVDRVLTGQRLIPNIDYATNPIYFQRRDKEGSDGSVVPEFNPYRTTPKLLFKSFYMPLCSLGGHQQTSGTISDVNWWLYDQSMSNYRNYNKFTTYPFGINKFSHYINWSDDLFDQRELVFNGGETMYDVYWKDYIEDLTDRDNRLVTMEMYFDPFELANLKFDEKINVDNTLFRLNKVKNYSLVNKGLAEVELIKLTKEYEPHRKIYYTATPCASSECDILYSHSDLQYNLFAYTGKYIRTEPNTTGCGCMYLDWSYDPPVGNVTYTPIYIDMTLPYTGKYKIYDSCSDCESSTDLECIDVFDNVTPTPSPLPPTPTPSTTPPQSPLPVTPTPTPTITPSSTPSCVCYQYQIINNTAFPRSYSYTDCTTGEGVYVPYLPPQTGALICACQGSVIARFLDVTEVGPCPDPAPPTPTPTETTSPTPTPTATLTPTPSPTPGGGTPTDYEVCNTSQSVPITVQYVVCATGVMTQFTIQPGECLEACACSDIEFVGPSGEEGNMAVLNQGDCVYVCDRATFTNIAGTASAIMYRQTQYSGGTLTAAYYDGPSWQTASTSERYDYNNYVRNTALNGLLYQAYQGGDLEGTGGFTQVVWSNTDNEWIFGQTQDDTGMNPIYKGENNPTGGFIKDELGTGTTIYQGQGYPGISSDGGKFDPPSENPKMVYDDPCIQPGPTPTPSPYQASYYIVSPCGGGTSKIVRAFIEPSLIVGQVVELVQTTGCWQVDLVTSGTYYDYDVDETTIYNNCTDCSGGIPPSATPTLTPTPTPTPSVTQTSTPTPTPTPSSNLCTLYGISNLDPVFAGSVKYTDCDGNKQSQIVGPSTSIQICAQTGTVVLSTSGDMVSITLGDCT